MAAAKKGKDKGVDLAIVLGGPVKAKGGKPPPEAEPDADDDAPTPEFEAAFAEYQADPSDAQAFWRAVKACTESY